MTIVVLITAIIVGTICFGIGKLSVYAQQDYERDSALPYDPVLNWQRRLCEFVHKKQLRAANLQRFYPDACAQGFMTSDKHRENL